MIEIFLFYFSLLGYTVVIGDYVPYGYDAYVNINNKVVYFTEESLYDVDCFGLPMPAHELMHIYTESNWHSNGCYSEMDEMEVLLKLNYTKK